MDKDELGRKTEEFALRTVKLVDALPRSRSANAVASWCVVVPPLQATIEQPCRARSKAAFIAKIGVVEEEADESAFWLELVIEHKLMQEALVRPLLKEADELTAIMAASRISASRNSKQSALANRKSAI